MKEHLLQIDDFCYTGSSGHKAPFNLSIYKEELIAVCSSTYMSVSALQEAYHSHLLDGRLTFHGQASQPLSRGTSLYYIYTISKNAHLIPALSIADNIFSLRKHHVPHLIYHVRSAKIAAADLLNELHIPIDINTPVTELSLAENHLILLAKAYVCGAKLIIIDNIVEYYTMTELRFLLQFIQQLKDRGLTFLVFTDGPTLLAKAADRIFITRNFSITNMMDHAEYDDAQVTAMMLGGLPNIDKAKASLKENAPIMSIDWSRFFPKLDEIVLNRRECLCVFDMNSSNIIDLYQSFTQDFPYLLDNKLCTSYASAVKNGLAPITFSKLNDYFFPDLPLRENLTVPILKKISSLGVVNRKLQHYCLRSALPSLDLENEQPETELMKILLLRWQTCNPKVMLLSDLNVNNTNRTDIYRILTDVNHSGGALIILSSNLHDCLYFADKLLVIKDTSEYQLFEKEDYPSFVENIKAYLTGPFHNHGPADPPVPHNLSADDPAF